MGAALRSGMSGPTPRVPEPTSTRLSRCSRYAVAEGVQVAYWGLRLLEAQESGDLPAWAASGWFARSPRRRIEALRR